MQREHNSPPTVILMGLRGSGKSTLGRALARAISLGFVDLDDRSPRLLGCNTAADAIRTKGLAAFRTAEAAALAEVLREARDTPIVLALGGGTPTAPGAATELKDAAVARRAVIIYLHAEPKILRARLAKTDTSTRPSLTGDDMLDEIETVYLQRDPLYRTLASFIIDTDGQTEPDLVRLITSAINPPA